MEASGPNHLIMSRFFVASDDDDDEQSIEEEEEENETGFEDEEKPQTTPSKTSVYMNDSYKTKRVVLSEKQKRWPELKEQLDKIIDSFELVDYKSAYSQFQQLQKLYKKAKKAIDTHGHPNFFIRDNLEIQNRLDALADEKDLRKFRTEYNTFIQPFEDALNDCKANPKDFEQDDDIQEDDNNEEEDSDGENESDSEGGWFMSSDDEEAEKIRKEINEESSNKARPIRRKDMSAAEAVAMRLESIEEAKKKLDDDIIKVELKKFSESRFHGKIIATTQRLDEFLETVIDEDLEKQTKLEICYTVTEGPSDQPISMDDWRLVIEVLPSLVSEAKTLVTLFERLDKDFWARSVDSKLLFTPDVATLHSNLPKYLEILQQFVDELYMKEDFAPCVRLQSILIGHLYHKVDNDVMNLTLSILELASKKGLFDDITALNLKIRATLFLASNLAYRNYPRSACKLLMHLPDIPESLPLVRILWNRTLATIGISAFNNGLYQIAYDSLRQISSSDNAQRKDKQNIFGKQIYPPWLYIDPASLIVVNYASAMLLDLPFLTNPKDESNLIIKSKLHKDLQREFVSSHPETTIQRIAVAIHHAKNGDWKKSFDAINIELGKFFSKCDHFLLDLKKTSLCCFLLCSNQFYDNIAIDFLVKKFELTTEEVLAVIEGMKDGHAPVANAIVTFKAEFVKDKKFISFQQTEQESPLAEFGQVLEKKMSELNPKIVEMENVMVPK